MTGSAMQRFRAAMAARGYDIDRHGRARCPAHDGDGRNLAIAQGSKGVLLTCHSHGCNASEIARAVGLEPGDLFDAPRSASENGAEPIAHDRPVLTKTYDYVDEDGVLLFQVCRWEPKDFRQRRPDGQGDWIKNLHGVRIVPYRLPEIVEAVAMERTVYIAEGEKDADTLAALGLPATTAPMGAGKWRDEFSSVLAGADVVVMEDNDAKGRVHARQVAASVVQAGGRARIVSFRDLPEKGDVSDWIAQGHTLDDLLARVEVAPPATAESLATVEEEGVPNTRPKPIALGDLLARPELLEPPPALVPNLAIAGRVTLLSAREKTGKSTLLGQAAAAASWGGEFLGGKAERCVILWYAIDEPLADVVRRFQLYGANPANIYVQDRRPTAAELRAEIAATGATWVVVDTLTELWSGMIESDRSAEGVAVFLRPFVNVARETGIALTLSHHTRKDGTEYRGSVQLGATVDLVLTLRRPGQFRANDDEGDEDDDAGEDDGRRTLRGKGRGIDVNLRLSYDGTHYTLGEAHIPLRLRILRQLMDGDQSGAELASRLHVRKTVMLDELAGLRDEGLVMNVGKRQRITPHGEIEVRFPDSPIGSRPPMESTPGTDAGTDSSETPPATGTELTASERGRNRWEPITGTDKVVSVPDPNTRDVKSGTDSTSPERTDRVTHADGSQTVHNPEEVVAAIARENAEREHRRAEILARAAERARKTAA